MPFKFPFDIFPYGWGSSSRIVKPLRVSRESFTRLRLTLDDFTGDLAPLKGRANVVALVTDGKLYMAVDPQGYDYPRYKSRVWGSSKEVIESVERDGWVRKGEV